VRRYVVRTLSLTVFVVALVGCSKSAEPTTRAPTDKDRLQGVWAVEAVEYGGELTPEARQQMTDSKLHVQGDRFSLGAGDNWEFSTFAADWSKEPKGITLYECGPDGKQLGPTGGVPKAPLTRGWIYKFEGDKLVLAFLRTRDSDSIPPPADFKAEAGQIVMVLRLVKTNEEPRTDWSAVPAPPAPAKKKRK
jgi:uncharacterized protein (TIGR03067 family)